ncbi:BTB/POZ domain-containing protein [Canna indica]|uniref:BTB/POZ domain-containing protein n=1 Tax=Canna indica TaxID=4628 RepID=A0AAQ3L2M2_9LILI|nr:BTB/POZ domain-containing protein [Canna indica]
MYEEDAVKWLREVGVSRAIDILEVSSMVMFDKGIKACLIYIEAVPWSESEEDKLKSLFTRCKFDGATSENVLSRLGPQDSDNSEDLVALPMQLIQSVTNGTDRKARKEMQCLITGLLSASSIYNKETTGLDKKQLYDICYSCLNSLIQLSEEASDYLRRQEPKPLIERVSKQVENLNWLLEILIEKDMAEDFVHLWANQEELITMHQRASLLMRYELSCISAMLMDFGWLQRCSKGLDMRTLEESLGQALLTLPLKQQQSCFEEWFCCFAEYGTECPNLGKAFQVWWRRLFGRSSGACR